MLVCIYTCQNATLLEISCCGSNILFYVDDDYSILVSNVLMFRSHIAVF